MLQSLLVCKILQERAGVKMVGFSHPVLGSLEANQSFKACRDFLVRVLGWIPRNYNYGDGLKTIYPPLQGRFGDKNLNLAVGVLHELIEVKALSSFPEAVYQRWKFRQLHRHVSRTVEVSILTQLLTRSEGIFWTSSHLSLQSDRWTSHTH